MTEIKRERSEIIINKNNKLNIKIILSKNDDLETENLVTKNLVHIFEQRIKKIL